MMMRSWSARAVCFSLVLSIACAATVAQVAVAAPEDFGLTALPIAAGGSATPPLPDPAILRSQLVVDDNGAESSFGFTGATTRQFLFFNSFGNPGRFELEQIWVLFPASMDLMVGDAVQLAVYRDFDGDPTNGATLLATYDVTIQVADGNTFSVYPIAPALPIVDSGDILIGVVNRYYMTGVDPLTTFPAALDTTTSQGRSFFALWAGDPPNPPDLASATIIDVLSGAAAGNFMVRGFGNPLPALPVPTLSQWGMLILLLAVGLVAARRFRRARAPYA